MDVLAHSAGSILATLYAIAHPERLSRLLLITPGLETVGVDINEAAVVVQPGAGHFPWIDDPAAFAAAIEAFLA